MSLTCWWAARRFIDTQFHIQIGKVQWWNWTATIKQNIKNYLSQYRLISDKIRILDERIILYKDLVKVIEPKWYENKWLWFFGGVIVTTQSIKLAGELVD